jgi:hypothetical protein
MIPKTIHYCWFGGNPLPDEAVRCIESWKRFLPDYQIKRWDESNFDVHIVPYADEAYRARKYAFVSDYARFWILYREGGVYFDTDVEVIRPMDDILAHGPFMGCQNAAGSGRLEVAPGLALGVEAGHPFYKELLDLYATLHFTRPDGSPNLKTVVAYTSALLRNHGMQDTPELQTVAGIDIYPYDYFNPKSFLTGKITLTPRTVSIHHFAATWHGPREKAYHLAYRLLGKTVMDKVGMAIWKWNTWKNKWKKKR